MKKQGPECQPFTCRHTTQEKSRMVCRKRSSNKVCPYVKRRKPVLGAEEKQPEKPIWKMPAPERESTSISWEVSWVRGAEGRFTGEALSPLCEHHTRVLQRGRSSRGGAAPEESKDKVTDKQEEPENFINETYMFHSVILKASLLFHCLHTGRQSLRTHRGE